MAKIVIGDFSIDRSDRVLKRGWRVGVSHVYDQCVVQESEESVAGLLSINQHHARAGNVAVGILNRNELIFDAGKIATQGTAKFRDLRWVGRGLAAQVLIPDQI